MRSLSSSKQEVMPVEPSGGCETIHLYSDASAGGFACEAPPSVRAVEHPTRADGERSEHCTRSERLVRSDLFAAAAQREL